MNLIESIMTKNPCYTAGRKITVKGLMLHSVGCPQPKAQVFIKNWNRADYKNACVHGFIDGTDGTVYQTLPWDRRGWHCASGKKGSGNNTHIGVEMCEPATIKYTGGSTFTDSNPAKTKEVVLRTYQSAVELFAMLCQRYGLDPLQDGVVISHKEGCARGIASNHGDPEHLWSKFGLTMDGFRKDVKAAMGDTVTAKPTTPVASPTASLPRLVKVTATALNVRSGPGTSHKVNMTIRDQGTYTIVEEQGGWGRLKSGAGWISLAYTKNV